MKKIIISLLFSFVFILNANAQNGKQQYKVSIIAFYNCENFYDTVHNTSINDIEFTPQGERHYTGEIYWSKVEHLATVISQMGTDINPDGPALLGVAEIENDTVLTDLINQPLLKNRGYKFIHYDSPDPRGVDVALIYNPKYFIPEQSMKLTVRIPGGAKVAFATRDILWVKGKLDGEEIHVYVNHWPSRVGGEKRSEPAREAAAMICKKHMDSIAKKEGYKKVIVMGDLNDDPINPSVTEVLNSKGKKDEVQTGEIFNPWIEMYKKGYGTLAYQDAWGLFDQIMVTYPFLKKEQSGFFFYQAHIFSKEFMVENIGRYKGYPMRTWDGNAYRGGYSDHFPTYIILLKRQEAK